LWERFQINPINGKGRPMLHVESGGRRNYLRILKFLPASINLQKTNTFLITKNPD
jgi:hypothetical protein